MERLRLDAQPRRPRSRPDRAGQLRPSPLPGWEQDGGRRSSSRRGWGRGSRSTWRCMDAGRPAPRRRRAGVERVLYVLEGAVDRAAAREPRAARSTAGGFAFLPPGADCDCGPRRDCRLNVFEKRYVPRAGVAPPARSSATSRMSRASRSWATPTPGCKCSCRRAGVRPGRQRLPLPARGDAAVGRGPRHGARPADARRARASTGSATLVSGPGRAT